MHADRLLGVSGLADDGEIGLRPRAAAAARSERERGRRTPARGSAKSCPSLAPLPFARPRFAARLLRVSTDSAHGSRRLERQLDDDRRPAPGRRLRRRSGRRAGRHARACRRARARSSRTRSGGSRRRRPRSRRAPIPLAAATTTLTACASRVLDDVRQRLLDDPVERRLVTRAGARAGGDVELHVEPAPLGAPWSSAARARPRARSRRARAGAARPSAGARRRARSRRARGSARRAPRRPDSRAAFSPSRIDASACPVSSCSSRASRLRSSSCPSSSARTDSRPTRSESSSASAARFAKACGDPHVGVGEARVGPRLSYATTTPTARSRTISGTNSAGARVDEPRHDLVDLRVVDQRVDPLAAPACQRAARLRVLPVEPQAEQLSALLAVAVSTTRPAVRGRPLDQHDPRVEQLAQPRRCEVEELPRSASVTSASETSFSDSSCRDHWRADS